MKQFGEALRQLRRATGISQRQLAEQLHLDFSYISKLENGRLPPPAADTVVAFAKALGVPPEELLVLTGKIPTAVQEAVGRSTSAQRFLLEAHRMGLKDEDWGRFSASLRRLRDKGR